MSHFPGELASGERLEVTNILGGFIRLPVQDITATVVLSKLVSESMRQRPVVNEAQANLEKIMLVPNETWEIVRHLVLFYRAITVEAERLHLSEAEYFRRHITVRQLQEIFTRIVRTVHSFETQVPATKELSKNDHVRGNRMFNSPCSNGKVTKNAEGYVETF